MQEHLKFYQLMWVLEVIIHQISLSIEYGDRQAPFLNTGELSCNYDMSIFVGSTVGNML